MTSFGLHHPTQVARHSFGLLTDEEVAELVGVTIQTLAIWRSNGEGPAYVKLGRQVFYRRADILAWIDGSVVTPGGNAEAAA